MSALAGHGRELSESLLFFEKRSYRPPYTDHTLPRQLACSILDRARHAVPAERNNARAPRAQRTNRFLAKRTTARACNRRGFLRDRQRTRPRFKQRPKAGARAPQSEIANPHAAPGLARATRAVFHGRSHEPKSRGTSALATEISTDSSPKRTFCPLECESSAIAQDSTKSVGAIGKAPLWHSMRQKCAFRRAIR